MYICCEKSQSIDIIHIYIDFNHSFTCFGQLYNMSWSPSVPPLSCFRCAETFHSVQQH